MPIKINIGELSESEKNHFEWKIPKFFSLKQSDSISYCSPSFTFANRSMHLGMYVPIRVFEMLSVHLVPEETLDINLRTSFSIKHCDGAFIGTKTVVVGISGLYKTCILMEGLMLRSKHFELLPEGTLTIVCDLKIDMEEKQIIPPAGGANSLKEKSVVATKEHQGKHETSSSNIKEHMKLNETDLLCKNLRDFLNNKDRCDAVLLVQDKEYKVHKSMLIARSSVFAAMFQYDTAEKETGKVIISDCDPESFQEFLEYVYCGRLEDISSDSALHLYYTSDKYNMQELKAFCIKYLMHNLTLQNACNVVSLADRYDEAGLLSAAQDFFNKNFKEIVISKKWEDLFKNNFRLANSLLVEMSKVKN